MLIYGIKDKISGKIVYIGQTIRSLSARFNQHLRDATMGKLNYPLYRAIRKYGKDQFEAFVIEECVDLKTLSKREKELIIEFNTLTPGGYNLMLGQKGGRHSEASKEKIRKAALVNGLGKWKRTAEHLENNRKRSINYHLDPTNRVNFLISNGAKEFNVYKAIQIQKKSPGKSALYEKGEFLGTWLDTVKIAKTFNLNAKVITQVLRKEKRAHKGLIFEYKEI